VLWAEFGYGDIFAEMTYFIAPAEKLNEFSATKTQAHHAIYIRT
jgi:hypothetical protein